MIDPKISLLIIGVGGASTVSKEIGARILAITQRDKINVEILSTQLACSQFNNLSGLNKMVAAALIPPDEVTQNPEHVFNTRGFDNKLFSLENFSGEDMKDFDRDQKDLRKKIRTLTKKKWRIIVHFTGVTKL